jgi:hypothetical protein
MLGRGPRQTLRLLILEKLTGLATLADLAQCDSLEQLGLYESRPADRRLDTLLGCKSLRTLVVGDIYPKKQVETMSAKLLDKTFWYRGQRVRGDGADIQVRWRAPLHRLLPGLPAASL